VENRNDGVIIKIETHSDELEDFLNLVRNNAPAASSISQIFVERSQSELLKDFRIIQSKNISEEITEISPDIAVCDDCLNDMKNQALRKDYPFINCTNCGPRFSIIKKLPYDRQNTTMNDFLMCENCSTEYSDVLNRRFHAQPVACRKCGPHYEMIVSEEKITGIEDILNRVYQLIQQGRILAVKGIGGFHLMCDAFSREAVGELRNRKSRNQKPFAVMFRDASVLREYAFISPAEEELLTSWRKPIVLLKEKKKLNSLLNPGINRIGAMLPYLPLHYLLFEKLETSVLVMTSGNYSEIPIVADNDEAFAHFHSLADAFLIYNREIHNRLDDSVAKIVNKKVQMVRRSRGFVPNPVFTSLNTEGIVATGAELKNCFSIGKKNQAVISQHIGDLKNFETYTFYSEMVERFLKLFRVQPEIIVSDMHPDYLSTKFAEEFQKFYSEKGGFKRNGSIPLIRVQHHHAHIASAMAENELDEKVIGVCLDGTGYGDDGNIWGGEFLICDLEDYSRYSHFEYIPMPGGDKAVAEPWRMAVSYLYNTLGEEFKELPFKVLQNRKKDEIETIESMIRKKINSPLTSSTGRLFDAVAALLNICDYSHYDGEGPMKLESVLESAIHESYDFEINNQVSFKKTIRGIVSDMLANKQRPEIAAKFHNTLVDVICEVAKKIRKEKNIDKVVFSGGTFQNAFLLENITNKLQEQDFKVYTNHKVPCNDGGISLGQLVIAAKRRALLCV